MNQTELRTVGAFLATSFDVEEVLLTDIDSALGRTGRTSGLNQPEAADTSLFEIVLSTPESPRSSRHL